MPQEPSTPVIIDVGEAATGSPTQEITAADVLLGAVSFTGVVIVVTLALALLFAGALVWLRRLRPGNRLNGSESDRARLDLHLPSR